MATRPMSRRQAVYGRQKGITITNQMFEDIASFQRDSQNSVKKLRIGMDSLMQLLALTALGFAQKSSRGLPDPQQLSGTAWQIPVRRITGDYYRGWRVRRVSRGVWAMLNESREAYFIEFGIHQSGRAVRRPIAKLTLIEVSHKIPFAAHQMLNWAFSSHTALFSIKAPSSGGRYWV